MAQTYNVQVEDSEGNKYCPKPDLLTTKEQLAANNAAGKSVDALVIKEINNNLAGLSFGITAGGEWGYRKPGADAVTPFSSFRGVELICNVQARFYNMDIPTKKDLFTTTVTIRIDKNGNVTLPAEIQMDRSSTNVRTPNKVYFTILSVTVNFL